MTVPVEPAAAFAFFKDPRNLARITPPWLGFRIIGTEPLEMRLGAEIQYRIRVAGIPLTWKSLITDYDPPFAFTDKQIAGPYRLWLHRHEFHEAPQGTLVSDRVDYALPFGGLGRIVHRLFVERRLRAIFDYRSEALARILWAMAK